MTSEIVRESFLKYFETQSHERVSSSRLVPEADPTILFTNAGMNQFKDTFLGLAPRPYKRATTAQKCVRAGGKHNDLENVGFTARHHTFFEMLGNFSFGDYFKKDAIHFAWEFVTRELNLPKEKLFVSVFNDDHEAADLWHKQEGVPKEKIFRFGEKDNFWRMGDSGPCGPCSEIFFDLGEGVGGDPRENVMGGSGDRYIEFWNLVFMQYEEDGSGQKKSLPNPSIDTGMGLERLCTILQNQLSNYHTDLFQDVIAIGEKLSGQRYHKLVSAADFSPDRALHQEAINVAFRVVADHARAVAFLLSDGVLPSNDGRGYVLRRILRRAVRYGRKLSLESSLFQPMVGGVIEKMGRFYPELLQQRENTLRLVAEEESRFLQTLDQGEALLNSALSEQEKRGGKTLSGELVFKLYDTFGFPTDLTRIISAEKGFAIDEVGFEHWMRIAKEKARASWKGNQSSQNLGELNSWARSLFERHGATKFIGTTADLNHQAGAANSTKSQLGSASAPTQPSILALRDGLHEVSELSQGQTGHLVLNKTCFYAESGGQVGDVGHLTSPTGTVEVLDCQARQNLHLLEVRVSEGVVKVGQSVWEQLDLDHRKGSSANHSATHLLQASLRRVLGVGVTQAGSLVEPERLRFDFTHVGGLSRSEIESVERLVNAEIASAIEVATEELPLQEALARGAMAMFGEKYSDRVRVVSMGDFSLELCGGTHVKSLAEIRAFVIVSESGVSSGVRRIEALTGTRAMDLLLAQRREAQLVRETLGVSGGWGQQISGESQAAVLQKLGQLKDEFKKLEASLQRAQSGAIDARSLAKQAIKIGTGHQGTAAGEIAAGNGSIKSVLDERRGAPSPLIKPSRGTQLVFEQVNVADRKALSDLCDRVRDHLASVEGESQIQLSVIILIGAGGEGAAGSGFPIVVSVLGAQTASVKAGDLLKAVTEITGGKGGGRGDFAQGSVASLEKVGRAKEHILSLLIPTSSDS